MNAARTIDAETLERFAADLLRAGGLTGDHAAQTARVLVWADLRGHASHGVMRIPRYVEWIEEGVTDARAVPVETRRKGALVTIDARRAMGPVALGLAADVAVEQAKATGVAWVLVKNHGHGGAIGHYVRRITDNGMIGLVMTASRPLMAYYGTKGAAVATNPVAIGLPGGMLFDMSTAAIAKGKINAALAAGTALPEGVAVDADGRPTTDPARADTILPLGGAKGSGLSAMIEGVTSMALANPLIESALRDPAERKDFRQNGLVVAVDPEAILDDADIVAMATGFAGALKDQPRAEGFEEVLMPGERGDRESARRLKAGVPLSPKIWRELEQLATRLGVPLPATAG